MQVKKNQCWKHKIFFNVVQRNNAKSTLPMANSKPLPFNNLVLWVGDSINLQLRTQQQLRWALQKGIKKEHENGLRYWWAEFMTGIPGIWDFSSLIPQGSIQWHRLHVCLSSFRLKFCISPAKSFMKPSLNFTLGLSSSMTTLNHTWRPPSLPVFEMSILQMCSSVTSSVYPHEKYLSAIALGIHCSIVVLWTCHC